MLELLALELGAFPSFLTFFRLNWAHCILHKGQSKAGYPSYPFGTTRVPAIF